MFSVVYDSGRIFVLTGFEGEKSIGVQGGEVDVCCGVILMRVWKLFCWCLCW